MVVPRDILLLFAAVCVALFFTEKRVDAVGKLRPLGRTLNVPERLHAIPLMALLVISMTGWHRHVGMDWSPFDLTIAASLAWAAASIAWAETKVMTATRLLNWAMLVASASLVASQLSLPQCAALVAACCGVYQVGGLVEELTTGTFRPGAPGYRFSGTTNATKQAEYSVLIGVSMAYLVLAGELRAAVGLPLIMLATVLLLLTRTLNSIWTALPAGAAGVWVAAPEVRDLLLLAALSCLGVAAACAMHDGLRAKLMPLVLLGRGSPRLYSISGRLVVWRYVLARVRGRLVAGYGYGGFWNAQRAAEAARLEGRDKPVPSSLSLYLETLVNTGIVGLALQLAMLAAAWGVALRAPEPDSVYLVVILTYLTLHSVFEAVLIQPNARSFSFLLILFAAA